MRTVSGSSAVMFSRTGPFHDSATVIAHLVIKAAFQHFVSYEELVARAQTEASRMGTAWASAASENPVGPPWSSTSQAC